MGKSLLNLKEIELDEINTILARAQAYCDGAESDYSGKIIANLFLEPSTRTHYSFITAAHKLHCQVLDFSPGTSSLTKGETFYDTVKTFAQFNVAAIVIRSAQNA
jgi:aspartate carbamoyltransferase catalytic subunit